MVQPPSQETNFTLLCFLSTVLRYACESWTINNNLVKRINAFEQCCCHRLLKIRWADKVPNEEVLL